MRPHHASTGGSSGGRSSVVGFCVVASLALAACGPSASGPRPAALQAQELARAPRILVATPPPPAPPDVKQTPSPGGGAVWRAGHYTFKGARYVWESGKWVVPPRDGLTWVPGFWQKTTEGGVWVVGHWR